jgi:hypothetical protein
MSLYDYEVSKEVSAQCYPFYSLIMAAMRGADTDNLDGLRTIFPRVWEELEARYNAPGGVLPGEIKPEPTISKEEWEAGVDTGYHVGPISSDYLRAKGEIE